MHTCIPIQRTIAALKLKNSVERETLNDMHMKAIKVIMYTILSFLPAKHMSTLVPV